MDSVTETFQANAIKALVNKDSLTHPDHPLHVPGEDGITLFLGE
jgi:hypothetical protein